MSKRLGQTHCSTSITLNYRTSITFNITYLMLEYLCLFYDRNWTSGWLNQRVWGNKTSNGSKGTLWGERIVQYLDSDGVYTDVYTCQNIHIRYVQFYVNYVSIQFILKEEK